MKSGEVNIFQKLCFEWWKGEGRKPVQGLKEVKAFFQKVFRVRLALEHFFAPELQMTRREGEG